MNKQEFMRATLAELREKTGVYEANWSDWFSGKNSPKLSTLIDIAKRVGMPPDRFIAAFMERMEKGKQS